MVYIANLSVANVVEGQGQSLIALLPTAKVTLHTEAGKQSIRVMFSLESWVNFISKDCLEKLGLPLLDGGPPVHILDGKMKQVLGKTNITISSRFNENPRRTLDVLVTDHVTSMAPSANLNTSVREPILTYQLADPTFHLSGEVDILLGKHVLSEIWGPGEFPIPDTACFAHDTAFGWVVMGGAPVEDGPEVFLPETTN